ncbi:F-box/kelch-repeat protein At3g23880-like [Silene latifolia]|uniref:F-box/kelch-repeat protein At3g23880-like n=1 Tax=Silene latifolia TaxID=37657 RepID=UPI003D77A9B5
MLTELLRRMQRAGKSKESSSSSIMDHSFDFKYLPPEIWRHILSNLPVKTLIRFRCVCKSWCSIIDHPDLVYALKRPKINSNTCKIFALELLELEHHLGVACFLKDNKGYTLNKTVHIFDSCDCYFIVGRCNELFLTWCFVNEGNIDEGYFRKQMSLWNPSIRKSLLLPPCPLHSRTYLFGFAPCSKDYKVIAISYGPSEVISPTKMSVAVYTLSDQQWTVRNDGLDISISDIKSITLGSFIIPPEAFYFEGAAHWIGGKPGYQSPHLVSFNFDSEKFTFMEIPAASDEPETIRFLFLLEESLALLSISRISFRIWVMEQGRGKGVWTKWYSSDYDVYDLFFNDGKNSIVLYHESDDGRFFIFGDKSYNISTGEIRGLDSMITCVNLGVYTESLVLWKGYGAENMTSLP